MTNTPKVSLRGLYKIFGPRDTAMMEHVRAGMGKPELLDTHKHVLGLQDINVDMQAGEITVVMGLSGSGKSTLIRHLNRLIEPTAGEILVDGEDVMQLNQADLRIMRQKRMSMVFQKFALLPHRTVLQNAAMGLEVQEVPVAEREAEAVKWLARVGLDGYENRYPSELSGGMQQRVGIARAVVNKPGILLADEPTGNLDPELSAEIMRLFEQFNQVGVTVMIATHDLGLIARMRHRMMTLRDGKLINGQAEAGV